MKRLVKVLLSLIVLVLILVVGLSYYMIDDNLATDKGQHDLESVWQRMYQRYPYLRPWRDSLERASALRDTMIQAADGTPLHAYYIYAPTPSRHTAIIVHGYTDNAARLTMLGRMYNSQLGYNVILPDLRFAGKSGGDHIQMGWFDRRDVERWIGVAPHLFGDSTQIVLHGVSMGAATVMMTSGDSLPTNVRAFVEDCGYTNVRDEFTYKLRQLYHLPAFPIIPVASRVCKWRFGWDFDEASSLAQVAKCHRPMLFIHGDSDTYVPTEMVYRLYDAKPEPKALYVVKGAIHARAFAKDPQGYRQHVEHFLHTVGL